MLYFSTSLVPMQNLESQPIPKKRLKSMDFLFAIYLDVKIDKDKGWELIGHFYPAISNQSPI